MRSGSLPECYRKSVNSWTLGSLVPRSVATEHVEQTPTAQDREENQVKAFGHEITQDATTAEREYAADIFSVNRIFSSAEWRQPYP